MHASTRSRLKRATSTCGRLTEAQRHGEAGLLVQAMSGFIKWLASQHDAVEMEIRNIRDDMRFKLGKDAPHARTPDAIADLLVGAEYALRFATETGAIAADKADRYRARVWDGLIAGIDAQRGTQNEQDPARRFINLISSVVSQGKAHIDGLTRDNNGKLVSRPTGNDHSPLIGWLLKEGGQWQLLLEPVASFQAAQRAAEGGGKIETDEGTLRKRLHEGGYLLHIEPPRLTIRPRIDGKQRYLLCMSAEVFGFGLEEQDDPAEVVL